MTNASRIALFFLAVVALTGCASIWEGQHQEDMMTMRAMLARDDLTGAINYYGNSASIDAASTREKIDLLCGYIEDKGMRGQYPGLGC